MNDLFTIELPKGIEPQDLLTLEKEVLGITNVEDAGTLDSRSIDAATIGLWVQVATGAFGLVSTAVPLVQKIIDLVRHKGIKGGKLRFEGGEIEIDSMTTDEFKNVLATINQAQTPRT